MIPDQSYFLSLKKEGGDNIFHHFKIIIIIYNARHMIIKLTTDYYKL